MPKPNLQFMKDLRDDSETKGFTSSDQYQELNATITEAERVLELVCNIGQNNKYVCVCVCVFVLIYLYLYV